MTLPLAAALIVAAVAAALVWREFSAQLDAAVDDLMDEDGR